MEYSSERETELRVQASLVAEKELRARITRDAALLAEAKTERDAIEDALAALRLERLGDRIAEAIAPSTEAVEPASPPVRFAGRLGERLAEALRGTLEHASAVVGARLQPAGVLGDEPGEAVGQPGTLTLPAESAQVLGEDVQSRVVIAAGAIRIWLAGLTAVRPGDEVVVAAVTTTGAVAEGRARVQPGTDRVRLELPWPDREPPAELAFGVVRRDSGS